jgi:hypothetical protein
MRATARTLEEIAPRHTNSREPAPASGAIRRHPQLESLAGNTD